MDSIRVFCPASVANVCCGFDTLGFCLEPLGDEIIVRKSHRPGVRIVKVEGYKVPSAQKENVATLSILSLLEDYPIDFGFEIEINKKIKPGSGLGSSAASAAGGVFAVNELIGGPLTRRELILHALKGESKASGAYHADNLAPVLVGGFTLVRTIFLMDVVKLPVPKELYVSILHPKIELKTSYARAILKDIVPLQNAVSQWSNVGALVSALYTNDYDLLSRSLVDNVIEPYRCILIPEYENIKEASISAGALGGGISGSGPAVFALSRGLETAQKAVEAMAKVIESVKLEFDTYVSKIDPVGIKIIE